MKETTWRYPRGPAASLVITRGAGPGESFGAPPVGENLTMSESEFGRLVYSVNDTDDRDFALIRIYNSFPASAGVAYWGGPTGIYWGTGHWDPSGGLLVGGPGPNESSVPALTELHTYGHGVGYASLLPARSLWALPWMGDVGAYAYGSIAFGDSGSPVTLSDGRALGILVAIYAGDNGWGDAYILRLGPQLRRAEKKLRIRLRLATASVQVS